MFEVNAVDLRECLTEDLKVNLVPMVTSSPGMGKSDIIKSIAKEFNLFLIDLRVSQCEPVDMQGFPDVVYPLDSNGQPDKTQPGRMTFQVPEYFPLEGDPIPAGYAGWLLFLDEFNSGNKQTEAACYKLILDRAVYKHKLHKNCRIITAGNLSTDRAIVNVQSTATTSRLTHYQMMIDHKVWIDWANENGIDHRLISFIKFMPDRLHKFDPNTSDKTFACPRTLEFASKIIKGKEEFTHITKTRLVGTLGEGVAVEFYGYAEIYRDLPTIEQILANPKSGWKVPTEPDRQFAITTMLAHNITEANIDKVMVAIERLPIEFQVITFKDIYKKFPALKGHTLIQQWISNNASSIF